METITAKLAFVFSLSFKEAPYRQFKAAHALFFPPC
jgi:hypothetical protein